MVNRCIAEIPSFLKEGRVDADAVRKCAARLSGVGYGRIAVGGLWGEYANLTRAEQLDLIRAASEGAGNAQIVAGAMDPGTDKAALRIAEHAAAGCHGHLCVASHTFSLNDPSELIRHFDALHDADPDGTLFIADHPARTGFRLPEEVRRTLCARLRATIVDCEPDAARARLTDCDCLVREELALCGASDRPFVSRLAALFPDLMQSPARLSADTQNALLTLLRTGAHPAASVKHAAWRLGLCASPDLLPPWRGLSSKDAAIVDAAVARAAEGRVSHA